MRFRFSKTEFSLANAEEKRALTNKRARCGQFTGFFNERKPGPHFQVDKTASGTGALFAEIKLHFIIG